MVDHYIISYLGKVWTWHFINHQGKFQFSSIGAYTCMSPGRKQLWIAFEYQHLIWCGSNQPYLNPVPCQNETFDGTDHVSNLWYWKGWRSSNGFRFAFWSQKQTLFFHFLADCIRWGEVIQEEIRLNVVHTFN
jgi:hypothetical protein